MGNRTTNKNGQDAERPLECGECKKPVAVCYSEVTSTSIPHKSLMCNDCPVLRKKLHGQSISSCMSASTGETEQEISSLPQDGGSCLCCGGCGMKQDEIKMGSRLGCPLCYEVFYEDIIDELVALEKIPIKTVHIRKTGTFHTGRRPKSLQEGDLSFKLVNLHKALHETLGREDYEQAAWLRDQIRQLTEEKESDTNE